MKTLDTAAALQKAYRLLSLRPHSEKEMVCKLKAKGFSGAVVQEALEKLRDLKYLHDASFARQWARHLAVNKLWGNRKISASLQEKGISKRLIDEAMAAARLELPEDEAVRILTAKKTSKRNTGPLETKEKHKIFSSLMGRGFPPGLILNSLGRQREDDVHDDDR